MAEFSPELFDLICERIANGESLKKICADDEMPSQVSVFNWLANDELSDTKALVKKYARAREAQADFHADEMVDIADDMKVAPDHKRVQIDARKWKAAKQAPKKYGDRVETVHSGAVQVTQIERKIVDPDN